MLLSQHDTATARTVAVNSLVAGQLFYLLNCRKMRNHPFKKDFFNNKVVLIAIIALIILQVVFTYVPFMNDIFATAPVTGTLLFYPLIVGIAVFLIVELEKYVRRKL